MRRDSWDQIKLKLLDNVVWPLLIVTFASFAVFIPDTFFSASNITFLLYSSAALGMITLGEAICLLSGHFDLSVGSIAGFSAVLSAFLMVDVFSWIPGSVGILLILAIGGAIGLINGAFIVFFDVNPFLQTLGTFIAFGGATHVISSTPITGLPESYLFIGSAEIVGIPVAIFLLLIVFAITGVLLNQRPLGMQIYAVGGNEDAAADAGIPTDRVIITVYILSGILAALGGLIYTGFLGTAAPTIGENAVFDAFPAAIIGGISLYGGRGRVIGALGGVLLLGTIDAGLVMLGVPGEVTEMINGIVLIGAILIYTAIESYRREKLSIGSI